MLNILLPSAGRKITLVRLLRSAVEKRGGRLIVADCDEWAAGLYAADTREILPRNDDPKFWDKVADVCRRHGIEAVAPARNADLLYWSEQWERDQVVDGVRLPCSPLDTIRLCADKWLLAQRLADIGAPHPATLLPGPDMDQIDFPCVSKPRFGDGGRGQRRIESFGDLETLFATDALNDCVIQTYIEGDEYSIDNYVGLDGEWKCGCARWRRTTIAGQIDTGETVHNPDLIDLGRNICASFAFRGPINIQTILGEGGPRIVDINARFPGGIGLSAAAGVNLAELLVSDACGEAYDVPTSYRSVALHGFEDGIYREL